MKNVNYLILLVFTLFFLSSCTKKNRFEIDTKKEKVEVTIHRFDRDLIHLDLNHVRQSVDSLYRTYPGFLPLYIYNVLDTVPTDTLAVADMFHQFV